MARYIDADALGRAIRLYANRTSLGQICPPDLSYSEMLDIIADAPTADVVPKSEYDNLQFQFEALDHECDRLEMAESNRHDAIEQAKTEVAREIFEEIEREIKNHGICYAQRKIAELKKKYTEDQHNG